MAPEYYHGLIEYTFSVSIKSSTHQDCLSISKKIRDYLSAWSFSCDYPTEHKSARKGNVLKRDIMVRFVGYPSTVVAFREGLRCICFHYNLYAGETTVETHDHSMLPKDSMANIIK